MNYIFLEFYFISWLRLSYTSMLPHILDWSHTYYRFTQLIAIQHFVNVYVRAYTAHRSYKQKIYHGIVQIMRHSSCTRIPVPWKNPVCARDKQQSKSRIRPHSTEFSGRLKYEYHCDKGAHE